MAFALSVSAQFVNQPKFNFGQHQVIPGESLKKISHIYYGSENTTLILLDNPWLYKRPNFNTAGEVINYRIYPGDVLKVRISGTAEPVEANTTAVTKTEIGDFTKTPVFWFMLCFLIVFVLLVVGIVGYIIGRPRNHGSSCDGGYPIVVRHEHRHTHQHNIPPMEVNVSVARLRPVTPVGKKE